MKLKGLLFAVALTASLHAQTTYNIVPTSCGVSNPGTPAWGSAFSCLIGLSPSNPLGILPTMSLGDDLLTDTSGTATFSTVAGPDGYLSGAVDQSGYSTWSNVCDPTSGICVAQVTNLVLYLEGVYAPASGGGRFTAVVTINFAYRRQYIRFRGWNWVRTATSGTLTIQ